MWRYPGPSCPNCSFSAELENMKVDTWVQGIHALRINRRSSSSPVSSRDWVTSP
jgi:hypothetical protein